MPVYRLSEQYLIFPDPRKAHEDGILAVGGDLSPNRILLAYQEGIFPWFNEDDPIIWWSPDPRFVLFPEKLSIQKSMRPYLNKNIFKVTYNYDFPAVIDNCQKIYRKGQDGTWLSEEMKNAYITLHRMGFMQSVEVWNQHNELVGGLYGGILGNCFFGESMFSKVSNASKFGFIKLVQHLYQHDFALIDCQIHSDYLASLGAELIPRNHFLSILTKTVVPGLNNFRDLNAL